MDSSHGRVVLKLVSSYRDPMAPDHLPDITRWTVHVIGESGGGKVEGVAVFPELEPWTFRFEARPVRGRLVLTQLAIEVDPLAGGYPTGGISSGVLNRLRVGALLSAIHARASDSRGQLDDDERVRTRALLSALDVEGSASGHRLIEEARSVLDEVADDSTPVRRGNPGFSRAYLRRVAEVRLAVEAEGVRPINAAVAHRLGLSGPDRARDHVNRATRAGWLSAGEVGRSARVAGPKLIAVRDLESRTTEGGSNDDEA